jgi:hypothetical protein
MFVLVISGIYTAIGVLVGATLAFPIPFFYITMTPAFYVPLLLLLYSILRNGNSEGGDEIRRLDQQPVRHSAHQYRCANPQSEVALQPSLTSCSGISSCPKTSSTIGSGVAYNTRSTRRSEVFLVYSSKASTRWIEYLPP